MELVTRKYVIFHYMPIIIFINLGALMEAALQGWYFCGNQTRKPASGSGSSFTWTGG
jgi:hypothetical protein